MHLPFWLTTALLFPVRLYQGRQACRTTPRLPEAVEARRAANTMKAPPPRGFW
jgi:hypothetical protein